MSKDFVNGKGGESDFENMSCVRGTFIHTGRNQTVVKMVTVEIGAQKYSQPQQLTTC